MARAVSTLVAGIAESPEVDACGTAVEQASRGDFVFRVVSSRPHIKIGPFRLLSFEL
jgi:hypothetical protein